MVWCGQTPYIGGMTETVKRVGIGIIVGIIALVVVRTLLGAVWGAFSFLVFLFAAIAIFDAVTGRRSVTSKVVWVAIILLAPILGAIAYWLIAKE